MGGLGEETIRIADELDSAGNTVKAVTKGFSIGAAGLTVISLLGAFMSEANAVLAERGMELITERGMELITGFDIMDPTVFFGVLIGAAIPALFSAMLILGVDRNAERMVSEIHRQFNSIPGLREGNASPDYSLCIDIAASGALKELIPAGLAAIIATCLPCRNNRNMPCWIHRRARGNWRIPPWKHRIRTSPRALHVQRRWSLG